MLPRPKLEQREDHESTHDHATDGGQRRMQAAMRRDAEHEQVVRARRDRGDEDEAGDGGQHVHDFSRGVCAVTLVQGRRVMV